MANNRLYILDRETSDRLFLAKSYGDGWFIPSTFKLDELGAWLEARGDWGCTVNGGKPTALVLVDEGRLPEAGETITPPTESVIKCPSCGFMGMEVL